MPGFSIENANQIDNKFNKAEFRRKHRWRVTAHSGFTNQQVDWLYLQKAARPTFKFEEAVVHHDQEQAYFAGKQSWEPLTLTFYDVEGGGQVSDISELIFNWLGVNGVGNFADATMNLPEQYKLDLELEMTTANGGVSESWIMFGCWPTTANWQDLNYEDTSIQLIEVTVRYDRASRQT
jgi:hypothetical protein